MVSIAFARCLSVYPFLEGHRIPRRNSLAVQGLTLIPHTATVPFVTQPSVKKWLFSTVHEARGGVGRIFFLLNSTAHKNKAMSVVGVDLGLQNSLIAAAGRGGVDVILNGNSNRLNP
jgi:hypothetical protein